VSLVRVQCKRRPVRHRVAPDVELASFDGVERVGDGARVVHRDGCDRCEERDAADVVDVGPLPKAADLEPLLSTRSRAYSTVSTWSCTMEIAGGRKRKNTNRLCTFTAGASASVSSPM